MDLMTGLKRTKYCGEFSINDVGKEVTVCGFTARQRDLGQLIFIDLRDRTGIVQLAFDDNSDREIFDKAFKVRAEYVLAAKGVVRERSSKNLELPTGEIEIAVTDLRVLANSETPPFEISDETNVNEELRLKYRYLDLRRPIMQKRIMLRHKIVKAARDYYDENGFLEIETPILIKSTPEGARDYLVPSRVFSGQFFALPQSPQLYKQLLMLSGFDRYMQIAKCFRDEDLRADRQPEFTQIDCEMSFVDQDDVMTVSEGFIKKVYKDVLNIDITTPFRRMPYDEAIKRYGSDKPDTRFDMELINLTDTVRNTDFRVFSSAINNDGSVMAINAKNGAKNYTRKEIDALTTWVQSYGLKGIAWTKVNEDGTKNSSFEKFLSEDEVNNIHKVANVESGDLLLVIANDKSRLVYETLGDLRLKVAKKLNLIDETKVDLLWVTDFPLFEYDDEEQRLVAMHHPFTMPNEKDLDKLETAPQEVHAKAYDMILNGNEVGGGSIRINNQDLQKRMFKALGLSKEQSEERFGFLMNAFKYGAPVHGGLAFGLDRLVMLMLNCDSIRDVMAFPKVSNSSELMSNAPSTVDEKQLEELGIKLVESSEK